MTSDLARHTRAAAQAITGNDAPSEWLLIATQKAAFELSFGIEADARIRTRDQLRKQITAVRDASTVINALLFPFLQGGQSSQLLMDHLLSEGEYLLPYGGDLNRYLEDLANRCSKKLEQIPTGGGQNRPLSEQEALTPSAFTKCAIAIQLLWVEIHNTMPSQNNEQAHTACQELWLAAGGRTAKSFGWKKDLKSARDPRFAIQAAALARQIGVQRISPETPYLISRTQADT